MIPPVAHLVWLGSSFPWVNVLALRSAAWRGGFERVVLHHADDLSSAPSYPELERLEGVERRRLDPAGLLSRVDGLGGRLVALHERVRAPVARSNLLRAALLALEGGVYLDMDTVTVASLADLRSEARCFLGGERIVLPPEVLGSRDPRVLAATGARLAAREVCRLLPSGHRAFARIEGRYPLGLNLAVGGSEPAHPFVLEYLDRMTRLGPEREQASHGVGTHLLQELARGWRGEPVTVYPPRFFHPLAPEVSHHWFRRRASVDLGEFLAPETRVVHWYASVRTRGLVPFIEPGTVRRDARHQAFSALAIAFLEEAPSGRPGRGLRASSAPASP